LDYFGAIMHHALSDNRGLSLIDVIIGVAIMTTLFIGVFGLFNTSLTVLYDSRLRAGGTALLEERMEYIRSLSYREIGTEGGIPSGELQETETVNFDDISYNRRTFVQYYDDPADGLAGGDENSVTEDYKRVKVEVSWQDRGDTQSVELASFFMPNGIETDQGGGTLSLQVFNAQAEPVNDAEIRIENPSTSPAIDTTTFTDSSGRTRFYGAPSASGYRITTTKNGYSQAQTYSTTDENVDPDPGHVTVSTSSVTSASFAIDQLSTISLQTVTPLQQNRWHADFLESSQIASSSNISVSDDHIGLASTAGGYATSGYAYTTDIGTSTLYQWQELRFSGTTTADTEYRLHVGSSTPDGYERIPDDQLSGNSSGFTNSPLDISSIASSSYDQLALEIRLSTQNTSTTPQLGSATTTYRYGRSDLPDTSVTVRGNKSIGERSDGSSIYKTQFATTTDMSGTRELTGLEWDTYHFTPTPASDARIAAACPEEPLGLTPATSSNLQLAIADTATGSAHSLRVDINDADSGGPVKQAKAVLSGGGENLRDVSGPCGNVFFADLSTGANYSLEVTADGYATTTESSIAVEDSTAVTVEMPTN
jgi:hypothetical protein